jgi:hypothetical protein
VPAEPDRRPEVRLSDAERDHVVARLRAAAGDGRLTLDEMEERVGEVYRARTAGDLVPLTADLPVPAAGALRATERVVGVFSGAKQKGHWRPAATTEAVAVFGSCRLDLCDAIFEDREIDIRATAVFGSIEVLVPEGVHVDLGGFAVLGSKSYRVRTSTPAPGAPSIHVDARALAGSVTVRTKAFNGRRR